MDEQVRYELHGFRVVREPFDVLELLAKAGASELGDYVAYYLGDAYLKTVHNAEALSTLVDFSKNFPDSLLIRDAHLVYASALLAEGRAQEAADLLEKDRAPVRADVELAVGRAYEAAGLPLWRLESRRRCGPNAARAPISFSKPSTIATRLTITTIWLKKSLHQTVPKCSWPWPVRWKRAIAVETPARF